MNTQIATIEDATQPAIAGNPMLSQIRDFIDADAEPQPLDPVGIVRRAFRGKETRVFGVAICVGLAMAMLGYLAIKPGYLSSGMVRVLPNEAKILYADSDDSRLRLYGAYVTAETELIRSRPVLESALVKLRSTHQGRFPLPADVGDISSMLVVAGKKGLISIGARSSDPQLSAATVNAVLTAYTEGNETARKKNYDNRRDELMSRQIDLERSLSVLNSEYLEVGGEHDAGTLAKAHITKTAQLEVLEERMVKLDNTIAQLQATGSVGTDTGNVEIQRATLLDQAMAEMTYERAQRLASLETLKGRYHPSHHKLRAAQGELRILEGAIDERLQQIATLGKAGALAGGSSQSAEESQEELEILKGELKTRRETIRAEAGELNSKLLRIRSIVIEQKRLEELVAETKMALEEVLVESQNDLSRAIEIIAMGKVPDGPIEDKRKPAALGGAVFGGLGALALFVVASVFAGKVHYSDDLGKNAYELLAGVIEDSERPMESMLEFAGKLRNEFDLRLPSAGSQPLVIAVVGSDVGAGATSMSSALATHYASAGRKVLLVDANPAGRGLCHLYQQTEMPGALAVIQDETGLDDAVRELPVDHGALSLLSIIPFSKNSAPPLITRQFAVDEMQLLLKKSREQNQIVIVDLGVLTAGRQSAVGAALADRTVLVTRSGEAQKNVDLALDLLGRMAPDRFLIALNRGQLLDPLVSVASADNRQPGVGERIGNLFKKSTGVEST
ncbi:MAG: hypothetical protein ABJK25_08645 [Halieaceae bacterium]